jgi:hypothetical protein
MRVSVLALLVSSLLAACGNGGAPVVSSSGSSGTSGSGTASTSGGSTGSAGTTSSGSSSGGLPDAGFPDGGSPLDIYCATWSGAACDSMETCSETNFLFAVYFGTQERCRDYYTSVWCLPSFAPLPGLPATPEAFVDADLKCAVDFVGVLADAGACVLWELLDLNSNQPLPASCYAPPLAIPGLNPPGAPCVSSNQCSSLICNFTDGCGACAEPSALADAGSDCQVPTDCALGLVCSGGQCASFIPRGQPCVAGPGTVCEPDTSCIDGMCQFRFGTGHPCMDGGRDECASGICQGSVCVANPIVSEGAICGYESPLQGVAYCDADSVCDLVSTPGQVGYCIARKSEGERCFVQGGLQGDDCRLDLACVQGVCQTQYNACLADGGRSLVALVDAGPTALPDASSDYPAYLAAATDEVTLLCQGLATCPSSSSLYASNFGGSIAECVSTVLSLTLVDADPPGTDVSSSATESQRSCNELLAAFDPCTLADTFFVPISLPAVCSVYGTLPAGSSCTTSLQCASGNCSSTLTPGTCGVCGDLVDAGSICLTTQDCAVGLVCAEGLCAAGGAFDAGCDPTEPCLPPLACLGGRCTSPLDLDAGCDPSNSQCAPTSLCNAKTLRCEPYGLATSDGGCGLLHSGALAFCPSGNTCKLTVPALQAGVCVPATAPGQPCTAGGIWLQGNSNCQPPYTCVEGYCGAPDPTVCE